jgi:hypothetical protein
MFVSKPCFLVQQCYRIRVFLLSFYFLLNRILFKILPVCISLLSVLNFFLLLVGTESQDSVVGTVTKL